jgi:hypothetical protein
MKKLYILIAFFFFNVNLFTQTLLTPTNGSTQYVGVNINFSWTSAPGATYYEIQFDPGMAYEYTEPVYGALSLSWPTYEGGIGVHNWRVRGRNATSVTAWSEPRSYTLVGSPSAPSLTNPANNATISYGSSITFSWSSSSNATSYQIQFDQENPIIVASTSYTRSFTSLGSHTWRVQAINPAGGNWSSLRSFTIFSLIAPTLLTPLNAATQYVGTNTNFTWNAVAGATSYELEFDPGTSYSYIQTVSNTSLSWPNTVSGIGNHNWRVRARNGADYGPWSGTRNYSVSFTTPTLSSPANGSTQYVGNNTTFSWSTVSGASSYEVEFDPGMSYSEIVTTTSPTLVLFNQEAGIGVHNWRVRARNGSYTSSWSATRSYIIATQNGSINVFLADHNNTIAGAGNDILRYSQNFSNYIDSKITNSLSYVQWLDIPTGTYAFEGYSNKYVSLWGRCFWGGLPQVNIVAGANNPITIVQSEPYIESLTINGTSFIPGSTVHVDLVVKNPSNEMKNCQADIRIDMNKASNWDFESGFHGPVSIPAGGNGYFGFDWVIPTDAGSGIYYIAARVQTSFTSGFSNTDATDWDYSFQNDNSTISQIQWSGFTWNVRNGTGGPGPNNWLATTSNIWVDAQGNLHLKILKIGNEWYCSELSLQQSLGYGEYTFQLSSNPENFDKNVVVGLFTYESDTREIDLEFSRWGFESNPVGWYVVQPSTPDSRSNFLLNLTGDYSTHKFHWGPTEIIFQSIHGHYQNLPNEDYLINQWIYQGSQIPPFGNERLHLNFWLNQGTPPSNQQEVEVVIKSFTYNPLSNEKPDLIVTDVSVNPLSISPGHEFTVNCIVQNTSQSLSANAGNFYVSYWLSENEEFDEGQDIWLGAEQINVLNSNSSMSCSKSLNIPSGTPAGNYHILIIADSENDVDEGENENNNLSYYSISVINNGILLSVPYYWQDGALWCVPTSVAMLLNYYDIEIKPWEFASYLNLRKNEGINDNPVVEILNDYYIIGNGGEWVKETYYTVEYLIQGILNQLQQNIPVYVSKTGVLFGGNLGGHAFIVHGYDDLGFIINDPSGALFNTGGEFPDPAINMHFSFAEFTDIIGNNLMSLFGDAQIIFFNSFLEGANNSLTIQFCPPSYNTYEVKLIWDLNLWEENLVSWNSSIKFSNKYKTNEKRSLQYEWNGKNNPFGYYYKTFIGNEENYDNWYTEHSENDLVLFATKADQLKVSPMVSTTKEIEKCKVRINIVDVNNNDAVEPFESELFEVQKSKPFLGDSRQNLALDGLIPVYKLAEFEPGLYEIRLWVLNELDEINDYCYAKFGVDESNYSACEVNIESNHILITNDVNYSIDIQVTNTGTESDVFHFSSEEHHESITLLPNQSGTVIFPLFKTGLTEGAKGIEDIEVWSDNDSQYSNDLLINYTVNSKPSISNLSLTPLIPNSNQPLIIEYKFNDIDGSSEAGTRIRWFRNNVLQEELNDQKLVLPEYTFVDDVWYVTIEASDGELFGDLFTSNTVVIRSIGNNIPSNIEISNNTIEENQPTASLIGDLIAEDPDINDTHTFELVAGEGDTDNSSFSIIGNELSSAISFDYETKSSYSVRIRATDNQGGTFEKIFTINIIDVNETPSGELCFEDNFTNLENWTLFGSPLPQLVTTTGNPSPCFDNNGDANYNSGAISNQTFDYSNGLTIETDMYVPANPNGCWMEGMFGIARSTNIGSTTWPGAIIHYEYRYSGSLCSADPNPKDEGLLIMNILTEDGLGESYSIPNLNDYLNAWHRYKIEVHNDRRVSFYIDDNHIYTSTKSVSLDYNNMPLLLGSRSSSYGKVYHDNIKVYCGVTSTFGLSGTLSYSNSNSSPLDNTSIILYNSSNQIIGNSITTASGNYSFSGLENGNYTLKPTITKTWSGATAMDITAYKKHIGGATVLSPLQINSGDVNGSNSLSTIDLTYIKQRIGAQISTFPVGDWVHDKPILTVNGSNIIQNISALCYGDANGSYVPTGSSKSASEAFIGSEESVRLINENEFEVPVRLNKPANKLSSVTLIFSFPSELFDVKDLKMVEHNEDLYYSVIDGTIRVVYSTLHSLNLNEGDLLMNIRFTLKENTNRQLLTNFKFTLSGQGEFGDYDDKVIEGIQLLYATADMNTYLSSGELKEVLIFPNPVKRELTIMNAENSTIDVYDMQGNLILTHKSLSNRTTLDVSNYIPGIYIIKVNKNNQCIVKKVSVLD